jgi:hypothetical protein
VIFAKVAILAHAIGIYGSIVVGAFCSELNATTSMITILTHSLGVEWSVNVGTLVYYPFFSSFCYLFWLFRQSGLPNNL